VLINLLKKIEGWMLERRPSILTLSGGTGKGKTHLLKRVITLINSLDVPHFKYKSGFREVMMDKWYDIPNKILKDPEYFTSIKNCGIYLLDDFLCEDYSVINNYTSMALTFAYKIIDSREGKPTLVTTNKTVSDIESIDIRIADRLFREGGKFIEIPTTTRRYLERKL
jgi:DNA replication protein DnaC